MSFIIFMIFGCFSHKSKVKAGVKPVNTHIVVSLIVLCNTYLFSSFARILIFYLTFRLTCILQQVRCHLACLSCRPENVHIIVSQTLQPAFDVTRVILKFGFGLRNPGTAGDEKASKIFDIILTVFHIHQ